jgi:hypothetical protein
VEAAQAQVTIQAESLELLKRIAERPEPQPVAVVTSDNDNDKRGVKGKSKVDQAVRLLIENPEFKDRTLRDLEAATGIDRNTWGKAKKRANERG